jgi:hypothetical protein
MTRNALAIFSPHGDKSPVLFLRSPLEADWWHCNGFTG